MLDEKPHESEIKIKKNSKTRSMIGVLLVLLSISSYVFFVKSVANDLSVAKASLLTEEAELEDLKAIVNAFEKGEKELDLTEVKRREILKAIPVGLNQDDVIRDIVDIAESYDIELNSLSFSMSPSAQSTIGALKINSSFEGNYNDLITFLEGIETNARILRVESISVQINALDLSDVKRATFSLTMDTYYQD